MRALIELPLNSNVDLKSVYSIIEELITIVHEPTKFQPLRQKSLDHNQTEWSI